MSVKPPAVYRPKVGQDRTVLVLNCIGGSSDSNRSVHFLMGTQASGKSYFQSVSMSEKEFLTYYEPSQEPIKMVARFYWALSQQFGLANSDWALLKPLLSPAYQQVTPKEPEIMAAEKSAKAATKKTAESAAPKPASARRVRAPSPTPEAAASASAKLKAAEEKVKKAKPAAGVTDVVTKVTKPKEKTVPKVLKAKEVSTDPIKKAPSVSSRIKELILENEDLPISQKRTDYEIFELVREEFGLDERKKNYVSWNRNDLKNKGELPETAVPFTRG